MHTMSKSGAFYLEDAFQEELKYSRSSKIPELALAAFRNSRFPNIVNPMNFAMDMHKKEALAVTSSATSREIVEAFVFDLCLVCESC